MKESYRLIALMLCASAMQPVCLGAESVQVTGPQSVGIGHMSGGKIEIGLSPQEAKALAEATGQELIKQLTVVERRLNAQIGAKNAGESISLGVVETFLATVKGKRIPREEWPQVFGELTRQYLELGERILEAPVTDDAIEELVRKANHARRAGRLDEADALLEQAASQAADTAKRVQLQSLEANRQAASLLASRASLAFIKLERERGAELLLRAFEQRAADVSDDTFWWLIEASDALVTAGNMRRAREVREKARDVALAQVTVSPRDIRWQGNAGLSYSKLGDTRRALGDLTGALESYRASMQIAEKLATDDPSNTQWLRDLTVGREGLGDALRSQGDLIGALQSYHANMQITKKLATIDPNNTEWQRDLAVDHIKIGDTLLAQRDFAGARQSYEVSMRLTQALAAADLRNAGWQRDLSACHSRIGDVQGEDGDSAGALQSYQASMKIAKKLAAVDPSNTQWQRDLLFIYQRIGDMQTAQADSTGALKSHQASMQIAQKLAAVDPSNAAWQQDLAISLWKLGSLNVPDQDKQHRISLLSRGLQLVESLQQKGRLSPAQEHLPKMIREALEELGSSL